MKKAFRLFDRKILITVLFLAITFYIGATEFLIAGRNVFTYFADKKAGILAVQKKVDEEYRTMLTFAGDILKNKETYINFNGFMARAMGQRYMNDRVKLENGHLAGIADKVDVTLAADQVTKLFNSQIKKGKSFLFVLAPSQVPKYENILPKGLMDYSNQNSDDLIGILTANGVPFLDLREEARKDNLSHADMFYKTDHHWKVETAFWAYRKIVHYLMDKQIIDPIPPMYTDINQYNFDVYEEFFLGSSGRRTGIFFTGLDDFTIITPKFQTKLYYNAPSRKVSNEGNFAEAVIDSTKLKKDYFSSDPYSAYAFANTNHGIYRNPSAPCKLRLLTIHDSFARPSNAFLSLVFSEHDTLDMRDYNGNFEEYYSGFAPDILIVYVNANGLTSPNTTYDFFADLKG